ncbi:NAD-dependent epimerase/dehydratase family protein [Streptomyces sp. NPDC094149]|uniref:NAD-dependent epimerase/dehydratase family protein n=1 Tax=Streptomyces sp. NPDC094149 TaxID=3155079 RepID=UPI0033272EA4
MDVFLTGASGYIGGAVAQRLIRDKHRVRGLTRTPDVVDALAAAGIEPSSATSATPLCLSVSPAPGRGHQYRRQRSPRCRRNLHPRAVRFGKDPDPHQRHQGYR